ncbi:ribosome hibernation-promoting factor, HPF/YfiA family [Hyphococcus luteus]|uniref:Ribosome hibernation promoting factor n=1 Tax=Hyphococcus luteus TaxID=2058213 RepID=A0A2S7KA88_9PROT|nr:ribosome-associated translation inhibitor RaiA [Marinicaulis flavus]PQA89434.1 ribosomal subunit interface protein [Marinicaulis flavus]
MDIQVSGKNMDLGDALQAHVAEKLEDSVHKYFDRGAEASVTFSKERHLIDCDLTAHLASGVFLAAHGEGGDAYSAFEESLEKLEKRVRRYKRRLKSHHTNGKPPLPAESASYYLIEPFRDEEEGDDLSQDDGTDPAPVIVAETQTMLREMTVGAAVMQLDIAEQPAVVFKNAAHGRINIVYRRRDGHIGWVDPGAS